MKHETTSTLSTNSATATATATAAVIVSVVPVVATASITRDDDDDDDDEARRTPAGRPVAAVAGASSAGETTTATATKEKKRPILRQHPRIAAPEQLICDALSEIFQRRVRLQVVAVEDDDDDDDAATRKQPTKQRDRRPPRRRQQEWQSRDKSLSLTSSTSSELLTFEVPLLAVADGSPSFAPDQLLSTAAAAYWTKDNNKNDETLRTYFDEKTKSCYCTAASSSSAAADGFARIVRCYDRAKSSLRRANDGPFSAAATAAAAATATNDGGDDNGGSDGNNNNSGSSDDNKDRMRHQQLQQQQQMMLFFRTCIERTAAWLVRYAVYTYVQPAVRETPCIATDDADDDDEDLFSDRNYLDLTEATGSDDDQSPVSCGDSEIHAVFAMFERSETFAALLSDGHFLDDLVRMWNDDGRRNDTANSLSSQDYGYPDLADFFWSQALRRLERARALEAYAPKTAAISNLLALSTPGGGGGGGIRQCIHRSLEAEWNRMSEAADKGLSGRELQDITRFAPLFEAAACAVPVAGSELVRDDSSSVKKGLLLQRFEKIPSFPMCVYQVLSHRRDCDDMRRAFEEARRTMGDASRSSQSALRVAFKLIGKRRMFSWIENVVFAKYADASNTD